MKTRVDSFRIVLCRGFRCIDPIGHIGRIVRIVRLSVVAGWLAATVLVGGCASSGGAPVDAGADAAPGGDRDPFIRANRTVLELNLKTDRYVLKPAAEAYAKLPRPVRRGVGNFFSNLGEPTTVANDLLQGKLAAAGRDTGRFVINTLFGWFGAFDVAAALGLPKREEDFGQTLAVWGVPAGPYLVLPLLGPSNLRDLTGQFTPAYMQTDLTADLEFPASLYVTGVEAVNARADFLGADQALELQPDKYLFLRETYRQERAAQIADREPGDDDGAGDALIDELLEDEDAN
ncbi:MAG: VacJ family lipoprotein [Gammaproteobacteria bacterium]|nr:VacJ family lipoprotein [Gammaproteobacteria bacterium]